jgi:hypothetical protein
MGTYPAKEMGGSSCKDLEVHPNLPIVDVPAEMNSRRPITSTRAARLNHACASRLNIPPFYHRKIITPQSLFY